MSVKKFEEYCENCGCPLDICCKPKQPVVSLQAIKKIIKKLERRKNNSSISKITPDLDRSFLGGYSRCIIDLKEELKQGGEKKK